MGYRKIKVDRQEIVMKFSWRKTITLCVFFTLLCVMAQDDGTETTAVPIEETTASVNATTVASTVAANITESQTGNKDSGATKQEHVIFGTLLSLLLTYVF